MLKIRRAKIALTGFVGFLVGLVILADSGHGSVLFRLAGTIPFGDKVGHLLLFGTLSFLVNLLARGAELKVFAWKILKGNAMILPVVTLEECSQVFFRSRTFDLVDLASDFIGICLCGWLAVAYLNWKRAKLRA